LPHTPPRRTAEGAEKFAWLEAMKLLRHPFVLVLFIVTFFDSAVHQCYFFWTERFLTGQPPSGVGISSNWAMPVMSLGQIAEIGTMAFLGYFLKRLGWRYTMIIGILGHAVRFAVFAFFPYAVPAILVILLHGICYAFFFATVYIFVDEFFPKDARSSAQGLFNFLILGLGPFLGNFAWGQLGKIFEAFGSMMQRLDPSNPRWEGLGGLFELPGGGVNFHNVFLVPSATAIFAALLLLLFFHPPEKSLTGATET
jgi:MFS family permease